MKKNLNLIALFIAVLFLSQIGYSQTELLTNGSFETGTYAGWTTTNTQTTTYCTNFLITTAGGRTCNQATSAPQDGTRVSINGFDGSGGEMALYQDVAIPVTTSVTLTFQFRIQWSIPSAGNQARIFHTEVRDTSNNILQTVYTFTANSGTPNQSSGWRTQIHDLSAYSGQTIRLYFRQIIPQRFTGPGQFEIDGIKLEYLAPTAALVGVAGRVQTENGYGIKNAMVSFFDADGQMRIARTNQFGYFNFEDVEVGNTYVFEVKHKRYQFVNPSQVINLDDGRKDIVFTAGSESSKKARTELFKPKKE